MFLIFKQRISRYKTIALSFRGGTRDLNGSMTGGKCSRFGKRYKMESSKNAKSLHYETRDSATLRVTTFHFSRVSD